MSIDTETRPAHDERGRWRARSAQDNRPARPATVAQQRPVGRFSTGMERSPASGPPMRVASFAEGLAQRPAAGAAQRVGSFADGLAQRPAGVSAQRLGSFADGFTAPADVRRIERRGDAPRWVAA